MHIYSISNLKIPVDLPLSIVSKYKSLYYAIKILRQTKIGYLTSKTAYLKKSGQGSGFGGFCD